MHRKITFYFLFVGLAFMIAAGIFLVSATPAAAQCGSQASSCKNCHEVQGLDSVYADGTGWHQSHAFGDFCYICHGGNQQATDTAATHTGMVDPLSDIKAACQQCHVADLQERAQVYADTLGVEIGIGSTGTGRPAAIEPPTTGTDQETNAPATSPQVDYNDPNLVNYVQQYNEDVLGEYPTNWGNIILILMIIMLAVGGGYLILTREKLISVKFGDTRKVEQEYPADVVEMLPQIMGLKAGARKSLKNVLENKKADKVLGLIDAVVSKDDE